MRLMMEKTFDATIDSIELVTAFVDGELEAMDCPPRANTQVDIAIDELFGNIVNYAYPEGTGTATVRVEFEEEPRAVVVTFIDQGVPYDPLTAEEPDISLSIEERQIGGLGIFLVRKTMDDMTYEYVDGRNVLHIRKCF
jgi:anti-sigma regulatory factor (Ser/Thr protein kinase)